MRPRFRRHVVHRVLVAHKRLELGGLEAMKGMFALHRHVHEKGGTDQEGEDDTVHHGDASVLRVGVVALSVIVGYPSGSNASLNRLFNSCVSACRDAGCEALLRDLQLHCVRG